MCDNPKSSSYWLAALLVLSFFPFQAKALLLDWNSVTWTAGNLSQSYDLDASNPGNDITITISGDTGVNRAGTPSDNGNLTGGFAGQNSLQLAANKFATDTQKFTVTITFNYAAGVDFSDLMLFDIDKSGTSYVDQIRNIYGINSLTGTTNAANITAVGSSTTLAGTGLNQTLTGSASSADTSGNGNATIDFGGKILTSIQFDYGNAPGTTNITSLQYIALYDIHFRPKVPEVNPALGAMLVCGMAIGVRAWRRTKIA